MARSVRSRSVEPGGAATTWLQRGDDLEGRDLGVLLAEPACPACRARAEAERLFLFWFIHESHTEPSTLAAVSRSRGFCPQHTRRLISEMPTGTVPTVVYAQVLRDVRATFGDHRAPDRCPVCAAGDTGVRGVVSTLLDGLDSPGAARRYHEHGGLCERHARSAIREAESAQSVSVLVRALAQHLTLESSVTDAETVLVPADDDVERRARLRSGLADLDHRVEPSVGGSTLGALHERLTVPACPICLATGAGERRYLAWLGPETRNPHAGPSLESDAGELCGTHLADLGVLDVDAARWAIAMKAARLRPDLNGVQARVSEIQRSRARGRRGNPKLHEAREPMLRGRKCGVCQAAAVAERRELALLVASLPDRATQARYSESHGLCVRHALVDVPLPPLVHEILTTRLTVLDWELEEARRKKDWHTRHESPGPEQTAWLRAPVQLDGRVFLGGPPRRLGMRGPAQESR
jgi:hypothetical protein